jgi:hypothetical protein
MVATRVVNQRASPITMRCWTLGLVYITTAIATCGEVTGLLCIKKINPQLNTSLIITNNKLDHTKPNCRIMLDMMKIRNATDMLRGLLMNPKHGEVLVGMQINAAVWGYGRSVKYHQRSRSLQAGAIALSETNAEWHNHELRSNPYKVPIKAFGAARTEYGTSCDKFETSNYKP